MIIKKTTSRSIASRTVCIEAFAPLQPVGLDQFLVGSKRLLRLWQSADAAVSLTQLKVGGFTIRRKFSRGFETFDGAGSITLLQKCATELESRRFVVRLGLHDLAQQRRRQVRVALHKKRVAKMIAGHWILRAYFQFGSKFLSGGFEITLTKVNKAHQKVRLGKLRIEL